MQKYILYWNKYESSYCITSEAFIPFMYVLLLIHQLLSGGKAWKISRFPHLAPADGGARSATPALSMVGIYAHLWVFIIVYRCLWVYMGVSERRWMFMGVSRYFKDAWVSYPHAKNAIWIIYGDTRKITVCSSTFYGVNSTFCFLTIKCTGTHCNVSSGTMNYPNAVFLRA